MKKTLTLALLLGCSCLHAQSSENEEIDYACPPQNNAWSEENVDCVTTPPVTIGNPDGFDWQGLPPGGGVRYPANGLQRSQSTFPVQVVNGGFVGYNGWEGRQYYSDGNVGTIVWSLINDGAPPPAAFLTYSSNPSLCPTSGTVSQKLHIGSNKRLEFKWRGGTIPNAFPPVNNRVDLEIKDAYSGQILTSGPIYYSLVGNANYSQVDLSAYAGLDVEVVFRTNGCSGAASVYQPWVDSVRLTDGPVPTYNGTATAGNWYNPSRSGSGWDLRRAPDGSYYAIWYTYDGGLQPIWYITSAGNFVNGRFQASLLKCSRTFSSASCPSVGRVDLTLKSSTQGDMRFDFGNDGQWDGEEFFTLLTPAGGAYSGHFYSNDAADPAWGITTMSFSYQNQQNLFTTMYYYNGSEPTWAVGTGTAGTTTTVSMTRQSGGLCPQCVGSYPAITRQTVGTMNLIFTGSNPALIADLNISSWLRPTRPYYMLSN